MGTVSILSRPLETVYIGSPLSATSNWNAGCVPINYKFQFELPTDRIIIRVYEYASNLLLSVSTHAPRPDLTMNFNLSESINPYLYSELITLTSETNKKDLGNTLKCYFTYQVYDLNEDPDDLTPRTLFTEESNYINVTQSAKQFGDLYGGNMAEYVPYGAEVPSNQRAKFLTAFDMPVKFEGYPFTLSFIYSDEIGSTEVSLYESLKNINGVETNQYITLLDHTQAGHVNYLNTTSYPSGSFCDLWLYLGDYIPQYYVEEGYVDDGYTEIL